MEDMPEQLCGDHLCSVSRLMNILPPRARISVSGFKLSTCWLITVTFNRKPHCCLITTILRIYKGELQFCRKPTPRECNFNKPEGVETHWPMTAERDTYTQNGPNPEPNVLS